MPTTPMLATRRRLLAIAALLVFGLGACATLSGPREVVVSLAQLQQGLAAKFPTSDRYLDLFDVTVSNPRLQLRSASNRVGVTVDAVIAPVQMPRALRGSFMLSGVLAIDSTQRKILLREPRMEELTLQGVDGAVTGQLAKISGLLAEKILRDVPLYTFTPLQREQAGTRLVATKISTTAKTVVVTFEPVK